MKNRYPIFIPSKGRWDSNQTARALNTLGVHYRVCVEPAEYELYARKIPASQLLKLPENFSERGQASIPARNWIWDRAIEEGAERYWLLDDNISSFYRTNLNRRIRVTTAAIFACAEDFTDRYENIAFSGFNNVGFVKARNDRIPPFYLNTRIYSMTLINTAVPYRWRGQYNEDTDICLRALKDGWCTIQFNAFLGDKTTTMRMRGGNTDTIYNTGDQRREFAESLKRQHPDVVEVTWKFGRWHHQVDYSPFKSNRLKRKTGVEVLPGVNEYGMKLVFVKDAPQAVGAQEAA